MKTGKSYSSAQSSQKIFEGMAPLVFVYRQFQLYLKLSFKYHRRLEVFVSFPRPVASESREKQFLIVSHKNWDFADRIARDHNNMFFFP